MKWIDEITELHYFFEAWFSGAETSFDRLEAALAPDFCIVGPDGVEVGRPQLIERMRRSHGQNPSVGIETSEHRLLHEGAGTVIASYLEDHTPVSEHGRRLSTVVFIRSPEGPNGLQRLRVHETWVS